MLGLIQDTQTALHSLHLWSNNIGLQGALTIAKFIDQGCSRSLREVHLSHNFIPFEGGKELLLAAARASAAGIPRYPMLVDNCAVPLWLRLHANIINVACPNMENFAADMTTLMLRERPGLLGASTNQVTMMCVRGPETQACSSSCCESRAVVHLKEITQQRGQPLERSVV